MPSIAQDTLEALADLACAHLGFVIFRKQHQLPDVQAALLLSVWIPRGNGQSADQWLVTGICTRLAYRIGVPDCMRRPAISRFMDATSFDAEDAREVNEILLQWHTWLLIKQ
ncbi:C6 finger domain protein [Penicillium angulare]|uniref:C6 finger domain protein n=1 Tax=Penicillium angulare TaxID=116970 RepID=A0A9W9KT15_9EURO|nr:C6 finger domain protein [Penicillium angulare]